MIIKTVVRRVGYRFRPIPKYQRFKIRQYRMIEPMQEMICIPPSKECIEELCNILIKEMESTSNERA